MRATKSDAALFRRPAPVMRDRGPVLDRPYFNSGSRQSANSRLAPGAGPAYPDLHGSQTVFLRLIGSRQGRLLRSERSSLSRTTKSEGTRTRPSQYVPHLIGKRHDGIVERRLDVHEAVGNDLLFLLLERLFLAGFCRGFSHEFVLRSCRSLSSCWRLCLDAVPSGCARWYAYAVREPAGRGDG